jgi:hypothetical protein
VTDVVDRNGVDRNGAETPERIEPAVGDRSVEFVPSTQRGPLAGLGDLARFLQQPGDGRRVALGALAAGIVAALALVRIRRR